MSKLFNNVWFKCISVLLLIAVVLGGLLAVLNDVLYVSPTERTERAIKKIYGEDISDYQIVLDVDSSDDKINDKIEYDFGTINKVFVVGNQENDSFQMLFQTTGFEGYKNGTITLWVRVSFDVNGSKIDKVIMESYDKQTLMSKLDGAFYDNYLVDVTEAAVQGKFFTTTNDGGDFSNPVSGATYSANAGNNAVNCVIKYLGDKQ